LETSGGLKVAATPLKRTSSPRPSFGEKKSTSLSATFKRFTLFGGSKDDLGDDVNSVASGSGKKDSLGGRKKKSSTGRSPRIGEMGEVFSEEPEPLPEVPEKTEEGCEANDKVFAVGGAVLASVAGSNEAKVEAVAKETLPPAPEAVVSHGETPGPQLALDSTEAGLHHHPEPAGVPPFDDDDGNTEETAEFVAASSEPAIEHLEDKVEDPAADAGVNLDPVPIIPDDPIEAVEVEETEPESSATTDEEFEEATGQEVLVTEILPTEPESADASPTPQPEDLPAVGSPLDG
jgi:hypothetical protein